jgi:hypothetical protein
LWVRLPPGALIHQEGIMNNQINKNKNKRQFFNMDIHIHTPASADFQTPETTYLDILLKAESRSLDIIAFTDHNTINGYSSLFKDIEYLSFLEKTKRLLPDEKKRLLEYKRLTEKILILPGFEFTAMFGFHIIALFSPNKNIREIEHLLIDLGVSPELLENGSTTIGASVDVIRAYQLINQAGGIVIAAHANSTNGVAMRGMNFGGQTRIAYTQDRNLHALEVTDLDLKSPRSTLSFFNGTKPEYPRRMHCIQGSDSHRLTMDPLHKKNLGIGDRTTDVLLPELSFESLKDLFLSNDFSRTRPHRKIEEPAFDYIQSAIDEGPNIVQSFHETFTIKQGSLSSILADICAFSNTNGGTVFIGVTPNQKSNPRGLINTAQILSTLVKEIDDRISPPLRVTLDQQKYKNKDVIRILVPRGDDTPYALDENQVFIRDESETNLAVRDEIVSLVERHIQTRSQPDNQKISTTEVRTQGNELSENLIIKIPSEPKTGVEITEAIIRGGKSFYTMRDLRNGNTVKNVTQASARRLWHYAISKYDLVTKNPLSNEIKWIGNFGLLSKYKQGQNDHYDFVLRNETGFRYFFGVTLDGIEGEWRQFLDQEEF